MTLPHDKPLRILIVEDRPDDAELLLMELQRGGLNVLSQRVETETDMRNALNQQNWDVILCDHALPRFGSKAALNLVKELNIDIPFIIVSGVMGEEHVVEAMRAGCHDYLTKGHLTRLAPAVEREMREAKSRRARRETERQLSQTTNTLNHILSSATAYAIAALDMDLRVIHVNPAAATLLRCDAETILGQTFYELPIGRLLSAEQLDAIAAAAIEKGKWEREFEWPNHDHNERVIHATVMPMKDEADTCIGYSVFAEDITNRKRSEVKHRELETELQHAQKLESLGVMAGGIAHDFNNLLTVIRGNIDLLALALPSDQNLLEPIENIRTATDHAADMTRNLLAFSRPNRPETRVIGANNIIRQTYNLLYRVLPASIEFTTDCDARVGHISADEAQLQQVLVNLCVNARDAMNNSGKLVIQTRLMTTESLPELIRQKLQSDDRKGLADTYVRFRVSDTGVGMDNKTLKQIFDPFFTTKAKDLGTGLGLSIVYRIIESHGGVVDVSSRLNEGTHFDLFLPMVAPEADITDQPAPTNASEHGHVLVIENEELIANLLKTILETHGHSTTVVHNAEEADKLVRSENATFDLAIIEYHLPDSEGLQCLTRLRARQPKLKAILLSGLAVDQNNMTEPNTRFIRKPFTADTISQATTEALQTKPARARPIGKIADDNPVEHHLPDHD